MTKECSKCEETKDVGEFHKDKNRIDKLFPQCKECVKINTTKYYIEKKENIKKKTRDYYNKNKNKINKKRKQQYRENPEKYQEMRIKSYWKNPELARMKTREYRKTHKNERNIYEKNKRDTDIKYKLKISISNSIYKKLNFRNSSKDGNLTLDILPYTMEHLRQRLECQFQIGMSWNNYGKWHIDHKKPHCAFNYKSTKDEELKMCWSLCNLQPLWANENCSKGGKWHSNKYNNIK